MSSRRVTVVGAGVVGLSIAHEFSLAGDTVTVIADRSAAESVSGVAAAVWFPYRSGASVSLMSWLVRSRTRFEQLAADHATGVDLRQGVVVERHPGADRTWTAAVPDHREADLGDLPLGAVAGVRATVPVISISHYLPWLLKRCEDLDVRFVRRTVARVDDLAGEADLVVVAAGLRSGDLLDDDTMFPVRGQVVRLANPGITAWVTDDDNPDGLTYVVPRREDIVCGGVAGVGSWDTEVDPETERAILRRATALMPALAGLPVLSRDAGLRPARDTIRLEHVEEHAVPVIACYGHGGSGVTLSWGCAEAVVDLAGPA
ncbi:FAD-binding oxidoreductase [Streptomyces sp. BV286]|uniref:FAD-dependent oxidoreductase n=1 Tax=Streptomyces sp. BV286 TaxID=2849672 RepID=UPI001C2E6C09|nr:FAD-dependent oxidoreductase [Streptomyces sp. BV286]MBV1940443.1 FAD-binding oxidoreductase [Streptomyces sp. BV286]